MSRRLRILLLATAIALLCSVIAVSQTEPELVEVATNRYLWTGVTVTPNSRVFTCFPLWGSSVTYYITEINTDTGRATAFPSTAFYRREAQLEETFVNVQSLYTDALGRLWALDPSIYSDAAKLVQMDEETGEWIRSYIFDRGVLPATSALNDVRIDTETETAFITDSGGGGIVVLDLESGDARRVLVDHPSTRAEDTELVVNGFTVPNPIHSDGIALDTETGWLYYAPLTGRTIYRIKTRDLRNESLSESSLGQRVRTFARGTATDGMLFHNGYLYLTAFEESAIVRLDSSGNKETIVASHLLSWPDSLALAPNGEFWVTTSKLHLRGISSGGYGLYRFSLPE